MTRRADIGADLAGFGRLTAGQQRGVEALLVEPTLKAAAERAGVGERTLRRWCGLPEFTETLEAAQRHSFDRALRSLKDGAPRAVEALLGVLGDPESRAGDRISAARTLLDYGFRAHEAFELRERVQAVEDALQRRASR